MALTVNAGNKTFTFPDGTSQADIEDAVNTNLGTTKEDYQNYVLEKGRSMGLPDELTYGLLSNESSGGDPRHFVGGKIEGTTERAQGPLQIRPSTAEGLGYKRDDVIRDPRVAADAALDYAKENWQKSKGDIRATLKAHFGGWGNAYTDSPELNSYADRGQAAGQQYAASRAPQQPQQAQPGQPTASGTEQPQQAPVQQVAGSVANLADKTLNTL